jgi:E3 ubiquitin-protein ligase synoviolin
MFLDRMVRVNRMRGDRTRRQRCWPVDTCFIFIVFGVGSKGSRVARLGELVYNCAYNGSGKLISTSRRTVLRTPALPVPGQRNPLNGMNPPPAQPGAVPRLANQPRLQPNANALNQAPVNQQEYDAFFRPREAPMTAPSGTAPIIGDLGAGQGSRGEVDEGDREIQRGIWGGPIVPGRFFPSPLGAAPRWSGTIPSDVAANVVRRGGSAEHQAGTALRPGPAFGPSAPETDSSRLAPARSRPNLEPVQTGGSSSSDRTAYDQATQPGTADRDVRSRVHGSTGSLHESRTQPRRGMSAASLSANLVSGSTTPFSSNPPTIFTSTGTARPAHGGEGPPESGDVDREEHDEDTIVADGSARRAAAEAAMRRFGIRSGAMTASRGNSESESSAFTSATGPQAVEASMGNVPGIDEPASVRLRLDKGKQKAAPISDEPESFSTRPTVYPWLSPVQLPPPHPRTAGTTEEVRREGIAAGALDERLRMLRDVDGVLWGLVGELSRMKSQWEAEDGEGRREGVEHAGERKGTDSGLDVGGGVDLTTGEGTGPAL